ncbi:MAG: MBL fold metallo-hydrolase [Dermatophilaceae bacterium]|nr:MBL fold metallo-hydrolase [Actinomycetales bacterium]MBP8882234.1 MBL fold metallo-hydrolase [Dermatophilaceae bacterium]MBP9917209.1 MBL fold metallo-hydrolase [Dermatophilaceae bacterium]
MPSLDPATLPTSAGGVRVEHLVTSGTFSLDGGTWEVDNNVWILGDDTQCVVFDAPHVSAPILDAIGDRTLLAILCTHAHDDHITAVGELRAATGASAYLHPDDRVLWDRVYDVAPDRELADGETLPVGDVEVQVLHTPGHAPGACCFYVPALGVLFSGDTLFNGGPGATGRSFSDFPTIIESVSGRLFALPDDTVVLTGHGDATTIGDERPHLQEWIDRGH